MSIERLVNNLEVQTKPNHLVIMRIMLIIITKYFQPYDDASLTH